MTVWSHVTPLFLCNFLLQILHSKYSVMNASSDSALKYCRDLFNNNGVNGIHDHNFKIESWCMSSRWKKSWCFCLAGPHPKYMWYKPWSFPVVSPVFYSRLKQLEKGFILDGVVLSKLANDETGRSHPSLNMGVPQYSALNDPGCKLYFASGLKTETEAPMQKGEKDTHTIFVEKSGAQKYIDNRKTIGAGKAIIMTVFML